MENDSRGGQQDGDKSVLKENKHQLEQLSKKLLQKAKQKPDPNYLYSLQLLQWTLDTHDLSGPWKDDHQRLKDQVALMFGWNKATVQKLLLIDLQPDNDPAQLGMFLAENLHSRLMEDRNP